MELGGFRYSKHSLFLCPYPPIDTVGKPIDMIPPCAVVSPSRAAGLPPMSTVADPLIMVSGGPIQVHIFPTVAAGSPPMNTVGVPGGKMGPPTCGMGGVPGVCIGHVCISPTRAAGGITNFLTCQ